MKLTMILDIIVSLICIFGIIKQLLRIIWLYFPSFMEGSFLHKRRQESKMEMLLYYLLAIVAMSYFIIRTLNGLF